MRHPIVKWVLSDGVLPNGLTYLKPTPNQIRMEIYILRHGKAEGIGFGVKSDAKRRLTAAGREEMEMIADGIQNLKVSFNYAVSSPLIRAKETADIVTRRLNGQDTKVTLWNELKPEADVMNTHRLLVKLPSDTRILLVGHAPHLARLISSIISQTGAAVILKKGGLAILDGNAHRLRITGSLRSLFTPKQLKLCR